MDFSLLGQIGTANNLNSNLIDKLKEADNKAQVIPFDTLIENKNNELNFINEFSKRLNTLKESIELMEQSENPFNLKTAQQTGDSVVFNSDNSSKLINENIQVTVSQLSQKDVYQSNKFNSLDDISTSLNSSIEINNNNDSISINTINKTYSEIMNEINNSDIAIAKIEQVNDTEYRLIISSKENGLENSININENNINIGFSDNSNHLLQASNSLIHINGVEYNKSTNKIEMSNGLILNAVSTGDSNLNITDDNSSIKDSIDNIMNSYNNIITYLNDNLYSDDNNVSDKYTVTNIISSLKNEMFDDNFFIENFEFDKNGYINANDEKISNYIENNKENLYNEMIGDNKNGVLSKILDSLENNLLSNYKDTINKTIVNLDLEKEKNIEALDRKYEALSLQFAQYNSIISSFESSFQGLKQIIDNQNNS